MSDFTNDLRYPKAGALLFDTKDLVDVKIQKDGNTRSMTAVYSDPETGEVLQTSEGGGGTGGDFSIAEVTFNNTTEGSAGSFYIANVYEANELGEGSPACVYEKIVNIISGTTTIKVPMYKGYYIVEMHFIDYSGYAITTSGDVQDNDSGSGYHAFLISGDCTINISKS